MGKNEQFECTVAENGIVLVPKEFRERHKIEGGTKICLEYIGNVKTTIVPVRELKAENKESEKNDRDA